MPRSEITKTSATAAAEYYRELFAAFAPVAVKRMFSGVGIYADHTIFAIAIDGAIYLKADAETIPAFKREGLSPFTYGREKQRVAMSYWRMPDRLYDDPDELAQWSRDALAAARRAVARKARKSSPSGGNSRRKRG